MEDRREDRRQEYHEQRGPINGGRRIGPDEAAGDLLLRPTNCRGDANDDSDNHPRNRWIRLSWSLVSQVISSLTNFLLSLLVLRDGDLAAFGWFTLTFFAYLLGLNIVRAVAGTPQLLIPPTRGTARGACGVGAVLGVGLALCASPLVLLLPVSFRHLGIVMCVALPFALLQDVQRFASFARQTPVHAALLNSIWLLAMVTLVALVDVDPVVAWGAGAATATLAGSLVLRMRPAPSQMRPFLEATKFWRNGLLAETASTLIILQLSPYLVALVIGISAFGALRAAYTVLSPIGMLIAGVAPVILVSYQRVRADEPGTLRRLAAVNAGALAALAVGYLALVSLLPDSALQFGFGAAVDGTLHLILPIGVTLSLFAAFCTLVDALRGVLAPRWIALVRSCAAASELACSLAGGLLDGAEGAAIGGVPGVLAPLVVAAWLVYRVGRHSEGTR